jgi:Flp pilus assembly protein TadG
MKRSKRFSFRPGRHDARPTSVRAGSEEGSSLFELAMALPLLTMLLVGIIKGGILFYDYVTLADAVAVGARTLATSRGVSTACTAAETALTNAATNLVTSNITITISFPSTNTYTDSCTPTATLYAGDGADVQATYPCNLVIPFAGNLWPGCTLTSQTTVRIE